MKGHTRGWRSRRHRAGVLLVVITVGMVTWGAGAFLSGFGGSVNNTGYKGRQLLQFNENSTTSHENTTPWNSATTTSASLNCTPRSIENFPPDLFTLTQRQHGAVLVHVAAVLYIFSALAIICDDYFVTSLEKLCTALNLQPDVAGATFMAAGSSAPELFTSIVGLFFAQSDVGIGTIVGSAVFNILFIVAMCGLFSGMVIYLTWWPLMRDSLFYLLTVVALVVVMIDDKIYWYEATAFLVLYLVYITIMYFNPRLGDFFISKVDSSTWCARCKGSDVSDQPDEQDPLLDGGILDRGASYQSEKEESYSSKTSETFRRRRKGSGVSCDTHHSSASHVSNGSHHPPDKQQTQVKGGADIHILPDADDEEFVSPLQMPHTWYKRLDWLLMLPASVTFMLTVPNCQRPGCWQRLYVITFIISIAWIAALSYIMVWMVTVIGDTLDISDTVMGLTFLAAGTSLPDALASLFVARDGYGDMAVSNCIGSNVFDILVCLGLPWLIQTAMVNPGSVVTINSGGLSFSSITLLATVVFLVAAVMANKWRLNKPLGLVCLIVYAIVVAFCCMYELNLFGQVSLPACPR